RQRACELELARAVLEACGSGDDLLGTGRQHELCARDGADAAADPARERPGNPPDEVEVVPVAHRCVQIDHLDLRKLLELPDPADDVRIFDREPLALYYLDDRGV